MPESMKKRLLCLFPLRQQKMKIEVKKFNFSKHIIRQRELHDVEARKFQSVAFNSTT